MLEEERKEASEIPESLKAHIGVGSVEVATTLGKAGLETSEMRLLLPSNMSKEEENKWAKDQEE